MWTFRMIIYGSIYLNQSHLNFADADQILSTAKLEAFNQDWTGANMVLVLLVTNYHSPLLPQSAQEMSSSGFLSRFCSLVPKQKLQMGMGSATGWQWDRAEGKVRHRRESQLNSFIVQMKTTKWPCVSCCINKLTVNWSASANGEFRIMKSMS